MMLKPHKAADAVLDKLRFPTIVLPKIDGVRGCYLNNFFTARTLKRFRNTRMNTALSDPALQGFDGELVIGEPTDEGLCRTTTSYVNSFEHNTVARLPDWYVFDFVNEYTKSLPYASRLDMVKQRITNLQTENPERYSFLKVIPKVSSCNNEADVLLAHTQYIAAGYEGTIVRYANAPHKSGRSTANQSWFMRIKDAGTEEATILDLTEAQYNGNEAVINELGETERSTHQENKYGKGMIGALVVQIPDGRIITIGAGCMTHEERIKYWEQKSDIVGRICTYKYMAHGEHKMRRHPRFVEFRDEDL